MHAPQFNGLFSFSHLCQGVLHIYRLSAVNDGFISSMSSSAAPTPTTSGPLSLLTGPADESAASSGVLPHNLVFRGLPSNEPVHVLIRIYVVKVNNLFTLYIICFTKDKLTFVFVFILISIARMCSVQ